MNIRSAILAAADHIEANPHLFDIFCSTIGLDGKACALARIDQMAGGRGCSKQATQILELQNGIRDGYVDFCIRIRAIAGSPEYNEWTRDALKCAVALRLYADKYFPASPSLDPAYVSWRDALKRENGYGVRV